MAWDLAATVRVVPAAAADRKQSFDARQCQSLSHMLSLSVVQLNHLKLTARRSVVCGGNTIHALLDVW